MTYSGVVFFSHDEQKEWNDLLSKCNKLTLISLSGIFTILPNLYYPVGEHVFNIAKRRQNHVLGCRDGQTSKFLLNRNEQNFFTVLTQ